MRTGIALAAMLAVLAGPLAAQGPLPPGCAAPLRPPPGGPDVAAHLRSSFGEQRQAVAHLREAMLSGGLDGLGPECEAFWRDCLGGLSEEVGTAVAQGYLTGREALTGETANQGILEAVGLYCLGAWTPGSE